MMGKSRSLKWIIVVSLILEFAAISSPASAAPQTVTYHNPIAYIGLDGNVYVTSLDGITSTPLTVDGSIKSPEENHFSSMYRYAGIHWSPDGTQFSFVDTIAHKLYVARSGKGVVQVPGATPSSYVWQSALSPDNTQIVFPSENLGDLSTIPVSGGQPTPVGGLPSVTREQPDYDPAEIIRANELSYIPFDAAYALEWTKSGIVILSTVYAGRMWDAKGKELWMTDPRLSSDARLPIMSADGTRALTQNYFAGELEGQGQYLNAVMNFKDGKLTPVPISGYAEPLAWTPDGKYIFYGTQSDPLTVYDPDHGSFDYAEYTLSLWQVPITGGEPTLIFQRRGYDFGVVRVTADSKALVFSLVTSSVNKVQAKLRKAPQELQDLLDDARPEIIELPLQKGAVPRWIALGGNVGIGKGDFVVPVPASPVRQSSTCGTGTALRLQVGQRARVVTNLTLYSEAPEYSTGYKVLMPLNAGKEVLVVGGPRCDKDNVVWWKVNYQGIIGWTPAESDQTKWLEQ